MNEKLKQQEVTKGMDKQNQVGSQIDMDKLIQRGGAGTVLVLIFMMWNTMTGIQAEVANVNRQIIKVTTELDAVSPKDLRGEIRALDGKVLTREQVLALLRLEMSTVNTRLQLVDDRMKSDDKREEDDREFHKKVERRLNTIERKMGIEDEARTNSRDGTNNATAVLGGTGGSDHRADPDGD